MKSPYSMVLVDDHPIVREGVRQVVENTGKFRIIDSVSDGKSGLESIKRHNPEFAVVDISVPTLSGIDIVRELKADHNAVKVIILTRHQHLPYLVELQELGIFAYIVKDEAVQELTAALSMALEGRKEYISKTMRELITRFTESSEVKRKGCGFDSLSARERGVLKLIAEGHQSKEIAKILFISYHTVKVHRKKIMLKLGVKNISDLVKQAIKSGLVDK